MKKSICKKMLISTLAVLAFGATAFADTTPYCVRIYCENNTASKLKNAEGHGMFTSSLHDSDTNVYWVNKGTLDTLIGECQKNNFAVPVMHASNAKMFETVAKVLPLQAAPRGTMVQLDEKCQKMEK